MLRPLIRRRCRNAGSRSKERGFTMALVAVSLLALIAMAALSIDIGTLYQAKAEAQRAADAGALAAARTISISGITGDPSNTDGSWADICGGSTSAATLAATKVAQLNLINGAAASTVTVNYGVGSAGATSTTCVGLGTGFAVNPVVTVYVQQAKLPTYFARVFSLIPTGTFSNSGVSATATAEVFNPSDSGTVASTMIPVQPRCVKPWIVPNVDPGNGGSEFVHLRSGRIFHPGIFQLGTGSVGESFVMGADCKNGAGDCEPPGAPTGDMYDNPPKYNSSSFPTPNVEYVPALTSGTPGAIPSSSSCSLTAGYQSAIGGCDQNTVYACGTLNGATADLTINPGGGSGDTATAAQCLINQSAGRDSLAGTPNPSFPFQIQAGLGSPLVHAGLVSNNGIITTSNSIVTIPVANFAAALGNGQPSVTIVGFLQVFINNVDASGNLHVTVLNVAGCGDDATGNPTVSGTSPVPIRLITPP